MKKIILTTGGTGGHIYPALSIAEHLISKNIDVLFVGTNHRMEKKMIPNAGYKFIGLDILPIRNLKSVIKMIKGIITGIRILKKESPQAVIGFGNYISIPILLGAFILKIPIYIQEQNISLGLANRLFYKFSKKLFLAFESTYDSLPIKYQHKLQVTGNPLRKDFYNLDFYEERKKIKLADDEKVVLIMGGSLGSQNINRALIRQWSNFFDEKKIRVYWATGEKHYEHVMSKLSQYKRTDQIRPYFENMPSIMCTADIVLCRSGALTISELIELEKPSILIPYNLQKSGQFANTRILSDINASLIYQDSDAEDAIKMILELINNDRKLKKMRTAIKRLKKSYSAEAIVDALEIWGNTI